MTGFGIAVCIIVILVGVGMFFTGYAFGMEHVLVIFNGLIQKKMEMENDESGEVKNEQ